MGYARIPLGLKSKNKKLFTGYYN